MTKKISLAMEAKEEVLKYLEGGSNLVAVDSDQMEGVALGDDILLPGFVQEGYISERKYIPAEKEIPPWPQSILFKRREIVFWLKGQKYSATIRQRAKVDTLHYVEGERTSQCDHMGKTGWYGHIILGWFKVVDFEPIEEKNLHVSPLGADGGLKFSRTLVGKLQAWLLAVSKDL